MFDVYIILIFCFFKVLVDSTSNKIVASSSLIEFVSLPPEVSRVSQNNKRVRFELNTTEKVVVSSLLSPAKEDTVVSLISNTERTTVIPIPTIELISLPMEVSGDSHTMIIVMMLLSKWHALCKTWVVTFLRGKILWFVNSTNYYKITV